MCSAQPCENGPLGKPPALPSISALSRSSSHSRSHPSSLRTPRQWIKGNSTLCDISSLGFWLRMQNPDPNCSGNVGSRSVHYVFLCVDGCCWRWSGSSPLTQPWKRWRWPGPPCLPPLRTPRCYPLLLVIFSSAVDPYPYPDWIRIQWSPWILIRIRNLDLDPGGQKWPTNIENWINSIFWSAGCSFLRAETFSCPIAWT